MANFRLIHKEAATGQRTTELDDLEFRVWVQYLLSADDFGVCPATAVKLQGDNRRLALTPTKRVQLAITRLVSTNLLHSFDDHGMRYLYQHDWQDWQRLKHASMTSLPPIPGELLEKCSPKTVALFREFHPKIGKTFSPRARACDASANANADANDSVEEGVGETTAVFPARAPIIESPKHWGLRHAGHVPGFCSWMCLFEDQFNQFTSRIVSRGVGELEAREQVQRWATHVRDVWGREHTPTGKPWDFWNARWEAEHGSSNQPARGFDPLAGVKGLVNG